MAATMLVSPVPDASSRTLLPCNSFCLASRKSESNRAPRHTCKCVNFFSISNFPDYHLEPNKVNTAACAMRYCDRGERNVVVPWSHFECGLHIWDNDLLQEYQHIFSHSQVSSSSFSSPESKRWSCIPCSGKSSPISEQTTAIGPLQAWCQVP